MTGELEGDQICGEDLVLDLVARVRDTALEHEGAADDVR